MNDVASLERLPLAALDRRPADFISGCCLRVDNLTADYDRCLAGLYDNQIRLFLVRFRLAATCPRDASSRAGDSPSGLASHWQARFSGSCAELLRAFSIAPQSNDRNRPEVPQSPKKREQTPELSSSFSFSVQRALTYRRVARPIGRRPDSQY